jgi:flagellar motor switch protein FliG
VEVATAAATQRGIDIFHAVRGATVAVATAAALAPNAAIAVPVSPQQRAALAQRIQNVVEREMTVLERVVGVLGPSNEAAAERTAQTLAGISRTLREIAALNRPDEADDDSVPRDIDEFRNELARRIHALIDARCGGESGAGDEADAGANVQRD